MASRVRLALLALLLIAASSCAEPPPRAGATPAATLSTTAPARAREPVSVEKPVFDAEAWRALGERYAAWRRAGEKNSARPGALEETDALLAELSKFEPATLTSGDRTLRELMEYRLSAFAANARAGTEAPPTCQSRVSSERYRAAIYEHSTLALTPEQVRDIGLDELRQIDGELRAVTDRLGYSGPLPQIFDKLRRDPKLRFPSARAARSHLEKAEARALEAARNAFHVVPANAAGINLGRARPAPHWTPSQALGFYVAAEDKKPAHFYVNATDMVMQPKILADVLAFHETVPGHHLQAEVGGHANTERISAFEEGWGTYAERLADELGLYQDDFSRLGMLSFQSWRASRLVADTGLNAFCWTKADTKRFLSDHTLLGERALEQELQRLVDWPAHQVGYMIGAIEIRNLRREAQQRLGARFDLKDFHDVVLGAGQVPLGTLRRRVEEWVTAANAPNRASTERARAPSDR